MRLESLGHVNTLCDEVERLDKTFCTLQIVGISGMSFSKLKNLCLAPSLQS